MTVISSSAPVGSVQHTSDGKAYVSTAQGLRVLDAHVASALRHRESVFVKIAKRSLLTAGAALSILLGWVFWLVVIE